MNQHLYISRKNRLTWHDGTIPQDEIWVKIRGDKGGGSFKMSFQICNVPHPNSVENTFRIVTEELARVRSRQKKIVSTAWSQN